LLDVVSGNPRREITKKYGKAHSVDYLLRRLNWRHFKGGIRLPSQMVPRRNDVCKRIWEQNGGFLYDAAGGTMRNHGI
jgi:hypothetical protein